MKLSHYNFGYLMTVKKNYEYIREKKEYKKAYKD